MGAMILNLSSLSWYSSFVRLPTAGRLSSSDKFFLVVLLMLVNVAGILFIVIGGTNACLTWELGLLL